MVYRYLELTRGWSSSPMTCLSRSRRGRSRESRTAG